jgi:sugar phosphate isomerase/epimerase
MSDESSYGPVVSVLQDAAAEASDSGVVLGLETSLSPADTLKLVDLIDHDSVRVYYDLYNMAYYGHVTEAIPGIALLGKRRICQVHVKNGEDPIEDPGPIDWKAALREFGKIEYDGWYVFESQHKDLDQIVESTTRNIAFLKEHCQMPFG